MKRRSWLLLTAAALMVTGVLGSAVVLNNGTEATSSEQEASVNTAKVTRGDLAALVTENGTLTYSAQSDGSPYPAVNQANGVYTQLPQSGDKVDCGNVLYKVNDKPVLLLCGTIPAYRDLRLGDAGNDVRQLNTNLQARGYNASSDDTRFTSRTKNALEKLQRDKGLDGAGSLGLDQAVFLPSPARVVKVTGRLGEPAQPGAVVLDATSDMPEVQVKLDPSQQNDVKPGDITRITLPSNQSVTGKVARLGKVAQVPEDRDGNPGVATIPVSISLDDPGVIDGLDKASVRVEISTKGVTNVLSVPVTALFGKSGGGYAVEVVRGDGRRDLVAVKLGLFDTSGGRVEVEGDVQQGDQVVVPSS